MTKGNQIYEDLFDFNPVNVDVEIAIVMAGEECGVETILYQKDTFGQNLQLQRDELFYREAAKLEHGCSVIIADDRAFLFAVHKYEK